MVEPSPATAVERPSRFQVLRTWMRLLRAAPPAMVGAAFLLLVVFGAVVLAPLLHDAAVTANVRARNLPPFRLDGGFLNILGTDRLGRSILARLVVGSTSTLAIAAATVVLSAIVGALLGLFAGLRRGWIAEVILRAADVIMSLPSLLLAMAVLYVLGTSATNVVIVLAITRVPVFLRTIYAEVLEIRERMFVTAATTIGASQGRILFRHMAPAILPSLLTLATLDFALVMLTESGLSFLGLGLQPPSITWGLMVSEGRNYLVQAWWISVWPGLAITLTTLSLTFLGDWLKVVADPVQRMQLAGGRDG